MGFRCPACRTEFGPDRDAFKEHLKDCEAGRAIVSAVLDVTEDDASQDALGAGTRDETKITDQARA
jgi:hypothetical protein